MDWKTLKRQLPELADLEAKALDAHAGRVRWHDFWLRVSGEVEAAAGKVAIRPSPRNTAAYSCVYDHLFSLVLTGHPPVKTIRLGRGWGKSEPWWADDLASRQA